ncbi:MAG: hypothetical protein P4M08_13835 [Oligoflexia bacterium]|nr:hypothetical protein [Oligoflexia bacterium]
MTTLNRMSIWLSISGLLAGGLVHAAGGMEGGGGKGVLCGQTLHVLDLYEATALYSLTFPHSYPDLNTGLSVYGAQIAEYWATDSSVNPNDLWVQSQVLSSLQEQIISKFSDIEPGSRLQPTDDATLPALPDGCSFVQIAIYSDDGQIYRDRQYWDLLSVQDQAALILHETIYHQLRIDGEENSDKIRRVVGLTFAEQLPEPIFKPIWDIEPKMRCFAAPANPQPAQVNEPYTYLAYEFFVTPDSQDGVTGVRISFKTFQSLLQIERLSTFLAGLSTDDFVNNRIPSLEAPIQGSLFGDAWNIDLGTHDGSIQIRSLQPGQAQSEFPPVTCEAI